MKTRTKRNNAASCAVVAALSMLAGCGETYDSSVPKPVVSISMDPAEVVRGSYATISWSATGATKCKASGAWSGDRPISGTESILSHDMGSILYTLTCTGAGGSTKTTRWLTVMRAMSG
jgi:hypothetical protein